ncbi:MAG: TonB-dependent receptor [Candidatus Solibacter usitatus]|nr:TonB-dependent receptor [Candidatus Solibacter usitatus]
MKLLQHLTRGVYFLLCCAMLFAQSDRGTISGTVSDSTGAIVPGAKITVTNQATNVAVTMLTNETGAFAAPSLSVGDYSVRAEHQGFRPSVRTGIVLNAASSVRADITLEVGAAQQAVEIKADAIQLTTDSAKSSSTITNKLVDELPLVVGGALRSPFDLAILTPESKSFSDNNFILGGGQAASYGTTLDGVSANTTRALQVSWVSVNAPSLEGVTEFTVDTNGFKAEYGHAGGGQMSFASKSGTNEYHGSAYEFLRNHDLDARRFFEVERGVYKQNDFGWSVGGPVLIPKLYNGKNKTFFFSTMEWFRNRVGASATATTVPTPEMYTGDFRNWVDGNNRMIPIYNPFALRTDAGGAQTRDPFPNNQMPANLFDPLMQKAIGAYQSGAGPLKPNNGAAPGTVGYVTNNFLITNGTTVSPQTKLSLKGDHIFNDRNRLSGYYGYARTFDAPGPNGPRTLPGNYSNYNDTQRHSDVFRMTWVRNISPTIINTFYAGGNNWRENHDPPQATIISGTKWKSIVCMPNVPDCDQNLVNLRFSNGYGDWGGPANNGSENTIYSFNDDISWIRGSHSFKAGGMYQRNHYNGFGRQDVAGRGNFSYLGTGRPNDTNFTTSGGHPFASALLGWATDGGVDTIRFIGQQWPYFAGYFQDDWRITKRLTLNIGVRWETTLPPVEQLDRWSDFSPNAPNPKADNRPGALIYAGTGEGRQGSRTLAGSYFKAFGPRFGFSYAVSDKMVLRANFARSFGTITTVTGSTHQQGFTQTIGFGNNSNGVTPTFLFKDGLPAYGIPPFIDPSFVNGQGINWWQGKEATRPPENIAWNLSIQRQLSPSMVLDVAYNALAGSHLQANLLIYNQVDPRYLTTLGPTILNSSVTSATAQNAGIRAPFANFVQLWGGGATVRQALRPFPQYNAINTSGGGGDHSGHSGYHAAVIKIDKRYGSGLTFTTSYVFSKIVTDADSYWSTDFAASADHYNRRLEKSIGAFDVTHNFKLGLVWDTPFGKGKRFLNRGAAANLLGGWRLSTINFYSSGTPLNISTTISQPLFAGRAVPFVPGYDGWRGAQARGEFDPQTDRFFQPASFFGTQPAVGIGNMTRFNPKLRQFPNFNENVSVGKTFSINERFRLDFRWEAFNLFNRVRFGTGSNSLQSQNFGRLISNSDLLNSPRRMQLGLKLYF